MMLMPLIRRLPEPIKAPVRKTVARYRSSVAGRAEAESPRVSARRAAWERDGYLILPGLFDADQVRQGLDGFDQAWAHRRAADRGLVVDAFLTGGPSARMYFRDAPDAAREQVYKLNDMYLVDETVRSMVLAESLVTAMQELIGEEIVAINSLHFERGSSQGYHVDTFYMAPPPGGQLIVSSICLEDVHPDAGPLTFYPGSHLIEPVLNVDGDRRARTSEEFCTAMASIHAELSVRGLQPTTFLGTAGDTFLWHEQILHGGAPIVDMARTRRSIVTHYWTKASMQGWDVVPSGAGHYLRRDHQAVDG